MARLGKVTPQTRIYNLALGRYEHEFEMESSDIGNRKADPSGLVARQRVSEMPLGPQKVIFGAADAAKYSLQDTNKYFKAKESRDNVPTTEYQKKVGLRSEGSFMEMAKDKPYIELGGKALNQDLYSQAPSTDLLTEQDMYKLMTVYKPSMVKPKTQMQETIEKIAKLGQPYDSEKLSRANTNPREFMENDLQKIELYPSQETNKGDGGSNLVFDYRKEFHKGTQPMTREQLYNQTFNARRATSNINMMQRDAVRAKELLSTYGSKQHEQAKPQTEIRPEIIKGKEEEKKAEEKVQEQKSGAGVKSGAEMVFNAVSNIKTLSNYAQ
jgi:hypothetical protein